MIAIFLTWMVRVDDLNCFNRLNGLMVMHHEVFDLHFVIVSGILVMAWFFSGTEKVLVETLVVSKGEGL